MRWVLRMCAIVGIVTAPLSAFSQEPPNFELMSSCRQLIFALETRSPPPMMGAYCLGYVTGVRTSIDAYTGEKHNTCIPEEATNEQVVRTYITWASRTPEKRYDSAYYGILYAMMEAYRCK